jgi:ArsR family transcriptional regulator
MSKNRMRQLKPDLLKTLGQPTRLKILELLAERERCVCEIFSAIQEEKSNISKHLVSLRSQGIVVAERRRMRVFYRSADKRLLELLADAEDCVKTALRAKLILVA